MNPPPCQRDYSKERSFTAYAVNWYLWGMSQDTQECSCGSLSNGASFLRSECWQGPGGCLCRAPPHDAALSAPPDPS